MKWLNLVGLDDGSHQFMFDKQLVFAVRFALEARFLLHWIIWAVTGRSRLLQIVDVLHKDERFEHRPVGQKNDVKGTVHPQITPKNIFFLLRLMLLISLNCFGVSSLVLDISAVEFSAFSQIQWE